MTKDLTNNHMTKDRTVNTFSVLKSMGHLSHLDLGLAWLISAGRPPS